MTDRFVYVTFIRTTPEKLWEALTKQEFTRLYWFECTHDCDWKLGSPWRLKSPDGRICDSGEVLEIDPPRRLVVSWMHQLNENMRAEGPSRASFDLEPAGDSVKLTITHQVGPNSRFLEDFAGGWPPILASLKSLLETGKPLDVASKWPEGY